MRLRGTQAKLDAFRNRYREVVEESDLMNKKYEEAAGKLKDRLASKGIEVLNLKKQLAAALGQWVVHWTSQFPKYLCQNHTGSQELVRLYCLLYTAVVVSKYIVLILCNRNECNSFLLVMLRAIFMEEINYSVVSYILEEDIISILERSYQPSILHSLYKGCSRC